jgi:malic enzyme
MKEENEKVHWETEKLKAEVDNLKKRPRPFGQSIVTIISAATAVLGIGIQYVRSDLDYKRADILKQQALWDVQRLTEEKKELSAFIDSATESLADLEKQRETASMGLEAATKALAEVDARMKDQQKAATAPDPQTAQLISRARTEIATASRANSTAAQTSVETSTKLRELGTRVLQPGKVLDDKQLRRVNER